MTSLDRLHRYITFGHQHSQNVTNIEILSPTSKFCHHYCQLLKSITKAAAKDLARNHCARKRASSPPSQSPPKKKMKKQNNTEGPKTRSKKGQKQSWNLSKFSYFRSICRESPNYNAYNLNKYFIELNMRFDWRVFGLFVVNIWLVIVIEQLCTCVLSNTVISGSIPVNYVMHQNVK